MERVLRSSARRGKVKVRNETKLKGRTMIRITQSEAMPAEELRQAAQSYLAPLLSQVPDKRLRGVGGLMVLGILAGQRRLIRHMGSGRRRVRQYITHMAPRVSRVGL